jgi:hypothetical protein
MMKISQCISFRKMDMSLISGNSKSTIALRRKYISDGSKHASRRIH